MDITQSNKGGNKICFEGYMYTRSCTRKKKIWWKCSEKGSRDCRGSLSTTPDLDNPEPGLPHNHAADHINVTYTKCRNLMRQQAASSLDKPSQIFAQAVANEDHAVQKRFPCEENTKRSLRYHRRTPAMPEHLHDFTLPDEWKETLGPNPQQFLLYDNGPEAISRIIAFATAEDLRRLAAAETIYMDGNFKMAPAQFTQVYVIRVPFNTIHVSCVYALLQKKTRSVYSELFDVIVDRITRLEMNLNVKTVVTDFEDAVLRAVSASFGREVETKGCFYHLTQSTWRKIQQLSLTEHYHSDLEFRRFCSMLDGLAFLPTEEVKEGMEHLKTVTPAEAAELMDYFDANFSGSYRGQQLENSQGVRLRVVPPMYPTAIWNVHEATLDGNSRTNNICEGWNNKFSNLVGHHHPSVWKCIQWFQKEHATVDTVVQQDLIGTASKQRNKRNAMQLQKRLRRLCQDRVEGRKSIPEFLEGIGHNIHITRTLH